MLPGEDEVEFAGLKGAMFSSLHPEGALENQLVERAASLIWRMRRVQAFEVALLQWTAHFQALSFDEPTNTDANVLRNEPFEDPPLPNLRDGLTVGRMLETLLSTDLTNKLSRYETSMQRQLSMTLKELREMQRPRFQARIAEAKAIEAKAIGDAKKSAKGQQRYADLAKDPEYDPAYWAEVDRQRMQRMDPP